MFFMRLISLHCQKNWVWSLSSTGASLCCGRVRWAPPRFLFFWLLLFLYRYPAGASAEERGVWTSLTCHTSPPPKPWVSLSPAPFTGYGEETNDISDYLWTFTFIRGLITEVYIENTFPFLWVDREGHNEQSICFTMKWCVVWLSHFPYYGTQSKKTVIIKMIFKWFCTKNFNRRLNE